MQGCPEVIRGSLLLCLTKNVNYEMNYILIKNLNSTGLDTLVCETELDELDIWFMLQMQGSDFDDITLVDKPTGRLPDNTSFQWFTPDGEKELHKMILASGQ